MTYGHVADSIRRKRASAHVDRALALGQADRDVAPPDVGTLIAEDDNLNSEERAILCESGARPCVYGLLVKCCAMSLFERS